jgi:hypothetical protein
VRQVQARLRQADLKGLVEAGGAVGCGQMAHPRPLAFTQQLTTAGIAEATAGVGLAGVEAGNQAWFSHDLRRG